MSKLIKEFKSLRSDKQRWEWLIIHKDQGLRLELDNDDTILIDIEYTGEDACYASFESYIGCSEGVLNLLHAIGIDADCC